MNIPKFFSLATSRIPNFKGMKADLDAAMQVNDMLRNDQRIFIGNHVSLLTFTVSCDSLLKYI